MEFVLIALGGFFLFIIIAGAVKMAVKETLYELKMTWLKNLIKKKWIELRKDNN